MFAFLKRSTHSRITAPEPQTPTVEVGSFAHGVCDDCGWKGPGRRARSMAQNDARSHTDTCEGAEPRLSA